jgi:hypothetical protein
VTKNANYDGRFTEIAKAGWSGVMAIEADSDDFASNPQPFVSGAKAFFAQHQEGWIALFNGRDLTGWSPKITRHALGENFGKTFRVEDGLLRVRYDQYENYGGQFGHLFYKDTYS